MGAVQVQFHADGQVGDAGTGSSVEHASTKSKHGSMATLHTAVCATQDGRMAVTWTTGGDKDDRR